MFDAKLNRIIEEQPFPLIFVTISGAHLYGFPSSDSDFDLRGVHLLSLQTIVGLDEPIETIEISENRDELELDLVTHEARKFFNLLLKKNGYVLEQLFSPLVLKTSPAHEELKIIAKNCITKHHSHHYFGFAATQWKFFERENPPRVKPLLYVFRVLLTGIYLMQTGIVEANLITFNENVFKLSYLPELVESKLSGTEKGLLNNTNLEFYRTQYEGLRSQLQMAYEKSRLPETPSAKNDLNDLLVRLRLQEFNI